MVDFSCWEESVKENLGRSLDQTEREFLLWVHQQDKKEKDEKLVKKENKKYTFLVF
ncbi:hypothetical protein [Aquibacillus saliphilus]|uniref:hypothetical protein n=1 Tax=Aquibacillus saliphilus TaxID=1909422 RepID=UPI001CF0D373|nr:hypothetical protein [Aquibacillus saliphilus]